MSKLFDDNFPAVMYRKETHFAHTPVVVSLMLMQAKATDLLKHVERVEFFLF